MIDRSAGSINFHVLARSTLNFFEYREARRITKSETNSSPTTMIAAFVRTTERSIRADPAGPKETGIMRTYATTAKMQIPSHNV